jgi:hypothetical protein
MIGIKNALWYLLGFALGFWCCTALGARPVLYTLGDDGIFSTVPVVRPKVDYGNPIINDIESRVRNDKWSRSMRNRADKGNWVHEQTHNLNAHIGIAKKAASKVHGWTSAYVLDGKAFVALQPGIKLLDVGAAVPKEARGYVYKEYLSDRAAIRAWNDWPLYVLDETSAAANALAYERVDKGQDYERRKALAMDWADMTLYLVVAVEKGDPDYQDLGRLTEFVEWQYKRIHRLAGVKPIQFQKKPVYKLY